MASADLFGARPNDRFKTLGALRSAAFRLASATKGLRCEQLAVELHDSLTAALPGASGIPVRDVAKAVRKIDAERLRYDETLGAANGQ